METENKTCRIGIVGLGSMGLGMARNALKSGLCVKGYDIHQQALDEFKRAGGIAEDVIDSAVNEVDVLALMVVNARQIEDAMFGETQTASMISPGTAVVICSTVSPNDMRKIAERFKSLKLDVLDAPVSGGQAGAESGSLTIMASGSRGAFEKAKPFFQAIGKNIYHVGDKPGLGSTYKVVNQLAAGVHLAAAAEIMAFGSQAGCDLKILFDILSKSAGCSWMLTDRGPHILEDDYVPRSKIDIFVKDMGLVMETGAATKTPLILAAAAHQLFTAASSMGFGDLDDAAIYKVYQSMTSPNP